MTLDMTEFFNKQHEGMPMNWIILLPTLVASVLCLIFVVILKSRLTSAKTGKDIGQPQIDELAGRIKTGAIAFLKEEYTYLAGFVLALSIILLIMFQVREAKQDVGDAVPGVRIAAAFLGGALLSAGAGWLGMMVATDGNSRTTAACTESLNKGLKVAFTAGAVMGFTVVGLGLFGISIFFFVVIANLRTLDVTLLSGFGFGASSIALFARVAGGIYTKAADVGADLVGKVEAGIDEDDPHNPAVIADNVGDNVGDVAGMGADLFESYVGSIIATITLGVPAMNPLGDGVDVGQRLIALPLWLSAAGVLCSMVGFFCVSTKEEGNGWDVKLGTLMWALEKGMYVSGGLFVVCAALICWICLGDLGNDQVYCWKAFSCIIIGLVSGALIGKVTEYFTSFDFGPTKSITDRGVTGPATVIIQGLGVGMISCVPPTVILVATILSCSALLKEYGVAIAAVGMLATLGITLATDAYGPVADNAGGLAELGGLGAEVRAKTDTLDALGNTTAATGKGFAIGSAVLTSLSLLSAVSKQVNSCNPQIDLACVPLSFDVTDATVLSGVLFGAMLPMLFSALTMISVGKAAAAIIIEVRRQFHTLKNSQGQTLLEVIQYATAHDGKVPPEMDIMPDSDRCVQISTQSSVREMIAPGAYAILAPLFIGFCVGPRCLMGVLAGAIASGCMMAIMMSNAGGAWDNSKKLCEKKKIKKTPQGHACIVGDTVGDPFKDTSGPALNILIKLMSMVSLTVAPMFADRQDWEGWYYGFIPAGLFIVITAALIYKSILTWKDPISEMQEQESQAAQKGEFAAATENEQQPTVEKTAATEQSIGAQAATLGG